MNKRKKSVIREWVESIVIALVLALFIRHFVIQAFKIPSGSMRLTLMEGDRILVNKFIYGARIPFTHWRLPALRGPLRGDIIVFVYPEDMKRDFIKRLVALPDETLEIKNGAIFINGNALSDFPFSLRYYYNRGEYGQENKKISVPKDSYYVLGDNSASSKDSRYWGFVPKNNLVGKAILIYWPLGRIRIIE